MHIERKDILIYRGDTTGLSFKVFTLTDLTLPYNPTTNPRIPFNLTGYDLQMQVRNSSALGSRLLIDATIGNGKITVDDALNGEFTVTIPPADTASLSLPEDTYEAHYDVQATASTFVYTLVYGKATIMRDVTHP